MLTRRLGIAALVLLASCAECVKLKLAPYSTECVTDVASAGDLVCVARRATARTCSVRKLTPSCAHRSGSFVGSIEGGRRGDLFMYRTFFDLAARFEAREAGALVDARLASMLTM